MGNFFHHKHVANTFVMDGLTAVFRKQRLCIVFKKYNNNTRILICASVLFTKKYRKSIHKH